MIKNTAIHPSKARSPEIGKIYARPFLNLEAEEEITLVKKWHKLKDEKSLQKLIQSHRALVLKIALSYRGYQLSHQDLVSEGYVGIMQAVNKFDPNRGIRFSTYASHWIHAAMKDYILKSCSLVKIGMGADYRKLFFGLRRAKEKYRLREAYLSSEDINKIASEMDVDPKAVIYMNQRLSAQDYSLNASRSEEDPGEWQDWLLDETDNQEESFAHQQEFEKRHTLLKDAFKTLEKREFDVFMARRLEEPPKTLEELSEVHKISRERIRQIEMKAFEKIQKDVHKSAKEIGILD